MLPLKYKDSRIIFYGAGKFSKIVTNYFELADYNILGFVDKNPDLKGQMQGDYQIFGLEDLDELKPELIVLTVLNTSDSVDNRIKQEILKKLNEIKKKNNLNYNILCNFNEYEQIKKIYKTFSENHFDGLNRASIASVYINKGSGIEIGARHSPLKLSPKVNIKYVDKFSNEINLKQTPDIELNHYVNVDIFDDAQSLSKIDDNTQDFVIANHLLEHLQNPVLAVKNMLRVLKKDGVLFLTIPDKRYTFDSGREITPLEHIIKDFKEGPDSSIKDHLKEMAVYFQKITDKKEIEMFITENISKDFDYHYHVWTQAEIIELFLHLQKLFNFEIELINKLSNETLLVLRK